MKKLFLLIISLFVLVFSSLASAEENSHSHNWSQHIYQKNNWQQVDYQQKEPLPFKWHERLDYYMAYNHMQAVHGHEREWAKQFPDLHPYSWHGGFWYNGNHFTDAIMFYNDSYELVSVGFRNNGVFTFIRDDNKCFENHDLSVSALLNTIINLQ